MPLAPYGYKAAHGTGTDTVSVHTGLGPTLNPVIITVQLARDEPFARTPRGHTQPQRKLGPVDRRRNLDLDIAIKRIFGTLRQRDIAARHIQRCGAARIQGTEDLVIGLRIDHTGHLRNQTRQIRRTARRPEPWRAAAMPLIECLAAVGLKRIDIEETVTGEVHACQNIVIQRHLGNVDITGVALHKEETVVEKHISHAGTCLVVGVLVRQDIIGPEALDAGHGTQTARNVHLAIDYIVPYRLQRRTQCRISRQGTDVGHR